MVGIHGEMRLSKYKLNSCPTCEGKKSKSAVTCMSCFRLGLGTNKRKGKSPRYDTEMIVKLKQRINELKEEQKHGNFQ